MTQKHIGALLLGVWLTCAALLLQGATVRIPPARPSAVRVQAAGTVASTGTGVDTSWRADMILSLHESVPYTRVEGGTSYWTDNSASATNAVQTNSTYAPTLTTRGVQFDTGQLLTCPLSLPAGVTTLTVVARTNWSSGPGFGYLISPYPDFFVLFATSEWRVMRNGAGQNNFSNPFPDHVGTHTYIFELSSTLATVWMDNVALTKTATNNPGSNAVTSITIGGPSAGSGQVLGANNGLISLKIFKRALTAAERAAAPTWGP
jgi:hypothetical protein